MKLVVVCGLSGSGKSVALAMLEDLQWYTLDNVPARLRNFYSLCFHQSDAGV